MNFRLPPLQSSLDFDLGPSFMDEVMKALNEPKDEVKNGVHNLSITDRSPLVEQDSPFTAKKTSFDNIGMDSDSLGRDTDSDKVRDEGSVTETSSVVSREMWEGRTEWSPPAETSEKKKSKPLLKLVSFVELHCKVVRFYCQMVMYYGNL